MTLESLQKKKRKKKLQCSSRKVYFNGCHHTIDEIDAGVSGCDCLCHVSPPKENQEKFMTPSEIQKKVREALRQTKAAHDLRSIGRTLEIEQLEDFLDSKIKEAWSAGLTAGMEPDTYGTIHLNPAQQKLYYDNTYLAGAKAYEDAVNWEAELYEYLEHSDRCILSDYEQGEPTLEGGYRQMYRGKWYQARPVDETPNCDCGLFDTLFALKEKSKEFWEKNI